MTTWTDVINYVRTRYEVLEETADWLRFRLGTEVDRTQQVAVVDGVALLKHTLPLEDLGVREEFERPMALLVTRADALEHELTRVDRY